MLRTILLIWLSAFLVVGPIAYLTYVHIGGALHAVALKGALLVSGFLALVSTSIQFIKGPVGESVTTRPATDVSGTPGATMPLWTALKRILWIWLGSALILGPAAYLVEAVMRDRSHQSAMQLAILVSAGVAFYLCWKKRPSA